MRKYLIGVFAALMLFAFTACEQQMPTTGMVNSITATQTATYVVGETPDASGFTFTGYTNMGTTVTVDPADVTLTASSNDDYVISYKGFQAGKVTVDFETVTGITVDASNAKTEYYASVSGYTYTTPRSLEKTGLVVTAEYDGGEKVVSNTYVTVAPNTPANFWDTPDTDKEVTVTFAGVSDTYNVDIVENLVESVASRATSNYTIYYNGDTPTTTPNVLYSMPTTSDAGIYVAKTYQGGETVAAENGEVEFMNNQTGNYETSVPAINIPQAAGPATITMRYKGADGIVNLNRSAGSVTVTWTKRAVTSVEVGTPSELTKAAVAGGTLPTGFTFEAEYNGGTPASSTISGVSWLAPTATIPQTGNYVMLTEHDAFAGYNVNDRYVLHLTGRVEGITINETFEAVVTG